VFRSRIIHASSVFDARRIRTSPLACRRSSALSQDISYAFINTSSCSLCFGFFFECWILFFSSSQSTRFLAIDVVGSAPYTGIWTFLIVVFARHGNFQYYDAEILCSYYAKSILIRAFILVAFAGRGNLTILSH